MTKSNLEYEANIFAAQLVLPDDVVMVMVYNGYDSQKIAQATGSEINLVALKVARTIIPASYYFELEHLKTDKGKKKTGEKFRIQPEWSSLHS